MLNTINFIGNHLRDKLGDDIVDEWDNVIDEGLKDNEIKLGALNVLLEATSSSGDDAEMIFEIIEFVKNNEDEF
jgi:hypothetical protein